MKQTMANYTVIIEKEKRTGANKACYTAFVPRLGIATEADTVEEVEKAIHKLIEFHLQCLVQEEEPIPMEQNASFITKSEVTIPQGATLAYS